ncbi:MAG: citrate synthase [bacterium]
MSDILKKSFRQSLKDNDIPGELYGKYSVKKGLRNEDGTGVLVGLTTVSDVVGYKNVNGRIIEDYGTLYYRGIDVKDLVENANGRRYMYEETCYLILFGHLPNKQELDEFKAVLSYHYRLPHHYLERCILNFPAKNLMNKLQREILMFYSFDDDPDNTGVYETLEKGVSLMAKIPIILCYNYATKIHNFNNESLIIHHYNPDYSIAEQMLYLLRPDGTFSPKEAEVLDIALILHADHGGGNNSTFSNIVIASTGTDIYAAISGAIGSLKGPKHGGANLAVKQQMEKVINEIGIDANDEQIRGIVSMILNGDFNDHSGLIYGIGHAVYTLSDPRSVILSKKCEELSIEKNRHQEYLFYKRFAEIAIDELYKRKHKRVCTNVDFYSGLVYDMLGIPEDLFTSIFAMARTVGWVAHNVEGKLYSNRIIRPASKYVGHLKPYTKFEER